MKLRSRMHMEPYLLSKYWGAGVGTQIKSGVRLPGTAGNYISTPDSVENSITGDIDVRVYAKLDDWTPATVMALIAKYNTASQRTFQVRVETNGRATYAYSVDGITGFAATIAYDPAYVDGTAHWIRFTHDVDNGAGGHDIKYYTSDDGFIWTLRGTQTNLGITGVISLFDSTVPLEIGSITSGTAQNLAGTIYYAEVRNGIDGPIAARFDSSQVQVSGSQLPASVDGWTWVGTGLYKRDDYVRLVGGVGNYLSYPDTPANSVTGDIDIRAKFSSDDYTIVGDQNIIGKYVSVGNQRSYRLYISQPTGKLAFAASADGITPITFISTVAPTIADGAVMWGRVAFQVASGGGNGTATFYTSTDGTVWTPLGTTVSTAYAGTIKDSTAIIEIGTRGVGSADALVGNVYYAEVRNGINGPIVVQFDARVAATPWTINGAAWNWEGSSFTGKPGIALQLPGVAGNTVTTPDTAGNSIINDIDVRAKITPTSWVPASAMAILSKATNAGQSSWSMRLLATGLIEFRIYTDGTNVAAALSSTAPNVSGTAFVRFTRVQSTGAYAFYQSLDGQVWTPIGTGSGGGALIFDGTDPITVGARFATVDPFAGNIHYAEVRNGVDGPIVAKFDPTNIAKTGTRTPASTVQPGGTPNMLDPNTASIETSAAGWINGLNATPAQDATQFLDGTKSLSMTAIAAGSMTVGTAVTYPVIAGKLYTSKGSSRAAVTPRSFKTQINWYTSAAVYISTADGGTTLNSTSAWTEHTVTGVAPPTAAFAQVTMRTPDAGVVLGEVHYVDRISLVEAASVWSISGSAWDLVSV